MASYGLNEIKTKDIRRFIGFCIVASSLVIAFAGYLPFLSNTSMENIKKSGVYLDSLNCETVSVYALPRKSRGEHLSRQFLYSTTLLIRGFLVIRIGLHITMEKASASLLSGLHGR